MYVHIKKKQNKKVKKFILITVSEIKIIIYTQIRYVQNNENSRRNGT